MSKTAKEATSIPYIGGSFGPISGSDYSAGDLEEAKANVEAAGEKAKPSHVFLEIQCN